jgi:hypothetical protein
LREIDREDGDIVPIRMVNPSGGIRRDRIDATIPPVDSNDGGWHAV